MVTRPARKKKEKGRLIPTSGEAKKKEKKKKEKEIA